jgi:HK97 family phage major capsid protein
VDGAAPLLEQWLARAYADAWIDLQRTERIRGAGVGEGLGVLKSPSLITVAKEAAQAADSVMPANVTKMASRCWGYDEGAVWMANPMLRRQLQVLADATTGAPLYHFAESDDEHDRLAGRPVFYDERCSAPGDVGDLIVCRWSEYLDAIYKPLQLATSMHVRLVHGETAWRAYVRNYSAPWWLSPLTPRFGTDTLSPYVTLEAR